MALFPIYGLFKGDFVPHLVAVDTDDTMDQVAEKIAVHSVGRRIPADPTAKGYSVSVHDREVDGAAPLHEILALTGLKPLEWVTVHWAR
jgi:hypothetical protein